MPLVTVQMLTGRTRDDRRTLIREIGDVVARVLHVPAEAVRITLLEVPPENWGVGNTTMAVMRSAPDDSR